MNFDSSFTKLVGIEGDYVDNPADPGGATRWGVTERTARANGYTGDMKDYPQEDAKAVYKSLYWDKVGADVLPEELQYPVFDAAVNNGVSRALVWLQDSTTASHFNGHRLLFMTTLSTWPTFGKGWARRIAGLLMD